jgi:hypothetical protein
MGRTSALPKFGGFLREGDCSLWGVEWELDLSDARRFSKKTSAVWIIESSFYLRFSIDSIRVVW